MDYVYDRTGPHPYLPAAAIDPQGNRVDYTYDTPGNLIQKKELNGWDTVSFSYNANGTLKDATDGRRTGNSRCPNTAATYCYGYDANGNRTSETPPAPMGVTTYAYDSLSRITSVTDGKNQTTSFTYNAFDQVTQVQFSGGSTLTSCPAVRERPALRKNDDRPVRRTSARACKKSVTPASRIRDAP